MSAVRWIRRLCFLTSAACLVAAAMPSGAHADTDVEAGRPSIYVGYGAASGIHQETDKGGGIAATIEPFYAGFPEALSILSSDDSRARASTYFPGGTFFGLPALGCGQAGDQIPVVCPPPPFPTVADTRQAGKADATSTTSQQLGAGSPQAVSATTAVAHADRTYASADAVDAGSGQTVGSTNAAAVLNFRRAIALATGGPVAAAQVQPRASDSSSLSTGEMHAASSVRFSDPKNPALVVVTAIATVSGVDILGGAVHIDSVLTKSTYTTDGRTPPHHDDQVVMGAVTAGGMPAVLNQNGVTLLGANQGKPVIDAANSALQALFKATNSGLRLVSPSAPSDGSAPPPALSSQSFAGSCGKGEADGAQFFQGVDTSKFSGGVFAINATIGSACSDGVASPQRGVLGATDIVGDTGGVDIGGTVGTGTGALTPEATPSGSATGTPARSAGTTPSGRASTRPNIRVPFIEAELGLPRVTDRLTWLYLAFTLAFVGLCLGSRFFVPSRLPRHR